MHSGCCSLKIRVSCQSINQSINLLVETGTNISRDEAQSVEQQDIQGSQGALTVVFETLSNKHNKNLKTPKKTRKIYTLYSTFKSWK